MLASGTQRHLGSCRFHITRHCVRGGVRVNAAAPSATVSTSGACTPQQLQQLCDWAKSKGVSTEKVAVAPRLEDGSGVLVAAKDLAPGEAVLSVPDSLWLSPEAARKSSIGKSVDGLEPWLQIALLLATARVGSKDASAWAPYLAATPPAPNTSPLFWDENELRMLAGTQLLDVAQGYKAFFSQKYAELFGQGGELAGVLDVSPAAFLAAVATVRARAHAPLDGDAITLVPLADMVSHARDGNTAWKTKATALFGRGQSLVVEATRAVKKGEVLSMDKAPGKTDSLGLLDHGVLDTASPRAGYTLTLSLDPSDRLIDDKRDIVENNAPGELFETMTFTLSPGTPPSDIMLGFLRLRALKGADVFLLEPVFSADVWGFMCDPVSEDNERDVCTTLAQGGQVALSRYASSIDADLATLRSGELVPGSRQDMAVRVRLGEMECLDGMVQWFEERGSRLKRLTYYQERRLRRLGLIDDEGRTTYDSFFKDGIA